MSHAAEIARESGRSTGSANGPIDVDLEQLPAYEEVEGTSRVPQQSTAIAEETAPQIQRPTPISPNATVQTPPFRDISDERAPKPAPTTSEPFPPPNEPPPDYEEVQSRTVADNLEERLRE